MVVSKEYHELRKGTKTQDITTMSAIPITKVKIPLALKQITLDIQLTQLISPKFDDLESEWEAHIAAAKSKIPSLHIEDDGEVIYLHGLSPGCQTCKDGEWDCIFLSFGCNLSCEFCYSPHDHSASKIGSAFGCDAAEIMANHDQTQITGISFSGGEPFLDKNELISWISAFTTRYPDKYFWIYTNGLLVDEESLRILGDLGVDEIRYNAAASGYSHPTVMKNIGMARQYIPNVTIEIPAIPDDKEKVISSLKVWENLGVRYLNIHELMYREGTNSGEMKGERKSFTTKNGYHTEYHPRSRATTLSVMEEVAEQGLSLAVNDCSLQSKVRQVRGRRRSLAPLMLREYEQLAADGFYETYLIYRSEDEYRFVHPSKIDEIRQRHPDYNIVRLTKTAPVSVADPGRWISYEY